jgi:hypothetical protein
MTFCAEHALTWQEVAMLLALVGGIFLMIGLLLCVGFWLIARWD